MEETRIQRKSLWRVRNENAYQISMRMRISERVLYNQWERELYQWDGSTGAQPARRPSCLPRVLPVIRGAERRVVEFNPHQQMAHNVLIATVTLYRTSEPQQAFDCVHVTGSRVHSPWLQSEYTLPRV